MWSDPYDQTKAHRTVPAVPPTRCRPGPCAIHRRGADAGHGVQDGEALIDELRKMVECGLHGTGTCAMGTDSATSVADARCRVHGIASLRVVDCSIMPTPVSGNTNGPAMAVAERAAELILEDRR